MTPADPQLHSCLITQVDALEHRHVEATEGLDGVNFVAGEGDPLQAGKADMGDVVEDGVYVVIV